MTLGLKRDLPKVGTENPECPLPVSSVYLFLGSKQSEIGEAEKCPNPKEPLSGTPTAQIGGWEIIVLWVTYLHRPDVRLMHTSKI